MFGISVAWNGHKQTPPVPPSTISQEEEPEQTEIEDEREVPGEDSVAPIWAAQMEPGVEVIVPMPDGRSLQGKVNLARNDGAWRRIGGKCTTGETFSFATRGNEVRGLIQSRSEGRAWRIASSTTGTLEFVAMPLGKVVCNALPPPERAPVASVSEHELRGVVPAFSSRPNANHVLYLDFDGAIISDPDWAGGETIDAPRARLNSADIQRVWDKVADDYAAFNVDVTTNASRYDNADVGKRMRCIITRNDRAANGAGGIAYVDSFSEAGSFFTSDIPCWVFIDNSVDACAEALSHELGHTLGLDHDGLQRPGRNREYYSGQGRGATGWAPIMGVSYYRRLSQWSKGEYKGANNEEDDIAMITRLKNGFGFAPDETGGGIGGAEPINATGLMVEQDGVILNDDDVDTYRLSITGGRVEVTAKPRSSEGNVDLQLELLNGAGTAIALANPSKSLSATVSTQELPAGTYYLRVRGVGKGDPLKKGYSAYGSIGAYHLGGKVLGLVTQN
jgi:hypothetical protein